MEEDEDLQLKWSHLIANIVTKDLSMSLQQNAIDILSKISNEEAKLIDHIHNLFTERKTTYIEEQEKKGRKPGTVTVDYFNFKVGDFSHALTMLASKVDLGVANLIAFGLIRWEIEVEVESATASNTYSERNNVDVYLDVSDNNYIRLTKLGLDFMEICKFE